MPERRHENAPSRILLIANSAARLGGGEESLLTLIHGMDRHRLQPHVVVPEEGEMAVRLRGLGVAVTIVPLPPVRPWTIVEICRTVSRLRNLMLTAGIALVHAQGSRGALYANLAAWWLGVPVVWHVRVVDRDPWLDGILTSFSSAMIANSQATAGRFSRRPKVAGKIHVIFNGVDVERFSPQAPDESVRRAYGLPDGRPLVAFAGRLEHGKGPDVFLEAAIQVHQKVPDVTFVIAGEGPMRPALETTAKRAQLPALFVGWQSDLLPLLRLCAVVVVPSRQEAFSRVLIEAMAAEIPVIASRVGGIPEVCRDGDTGLLVRPEDPGALRLAIITTLSDPASTTKRVRAAAADVRARFSLARHVEQVHRLYATLLQDGPMGKGTHECSPAGHPEAGA